MPSLLITIALVSALLPFAARTSREVYGFALAGSLLTLVVGLFTGIAAILGELAGMQTRLWYLDPFAGLMVCIIGVVAWGAVLSSIPYLKEEEKEDVVSLGLIKRYFFLTFLFIVSMLATVLADNLGFMWITLEATTLATTLLVSFYAKKGSLEAAWKYLVLCSTGLSLGLLGFLILYAAAAHAGAIGLAASSASGLLSLAHLVPENMLKISFVFVLIGFGTKVGLAPMHAWLPDAHSRAPSPISGLLSGVVLNVALFTILRYKAIVDSGLGSHEWTNALFLAFGALSVAVPAAFILVQADYKRLLAYSSIEHMGLIVFTWGLGGIGVAASLIHMIGHALSKSMLFFGAGNILLHFKSTKFENIHTMKYNLPLTRALFLFGVFALLAAPPSPLFFSEYLAILAAVKTHPLYLAVVLFALTVIFAGFLRLFMPMLFEIKEHTERSGEKWNLSHTAMSVHLLILLALGIVLWTDIGRETLMRVAAFYVL